MEQNSFGQILSAQTLEERGKNGWALYRIPAIAATAAGTVLCCCEARSESGDWSSQRIFLYRSTDGGAVFADRVPVAEGAEGRAVHNPVLLPEGDKVHLLWNEEYRRAYHAVSLDDGLHFGAPVEITGALEGFRPEYDWNICALGPGHGCVLDSGRLIVPLWLGRGRPLDPEGRIIEHRPTVSGVIYSDDGVHWERGGLVSAPLENPNETTAAALPGGELLLNLRHESRTMYRAVARSGDGGRTFSAPVFDRQLPDPMCFGSLAADGERQVFLSCASDDRSPFADRVHLTLRMSRDGCRTWPLSAELDPCGGYGDVCLLPDGKTACCLYERQDGDRFDLICARISLNPVPVGNEKEPHL